MKTGRCFCVMSSTENREPNTRALSRTLPRFRESLIQLLFLVRYKRVYTDNMKFNWIGNQFGSHTHNAEINSDIEAMYNRMCTYKYHNIETELFTQQIVIGCISNFLNFLLPSSSGIK